MSRKVFQLIVFWAVVSIVGIVITQVFWVKKAFDLQTKQFKHNVNIALLNVTSKLCDINETSIPFDPIEQLSSNYFIVNLNRGISPDVLETILVTEFRRRGVNQNFEYGIYDCTDQSMVYGKYVNLEESNSEGMPENNIRFPKTNKDEYYFGVLFPEIGSTISGEMSIWFFFSFVLLIVVIFFGYALMAIFHQKNLAEFQKDFINNMTHEFKTPLTTISLSANTLKSINLYEEKRVNQYIDIIQKEAGRLESHVDKILGVATLGKTKIHLNCQMLDVVDLIDDGIKSVSILVNEHQGNILFQRPDYSFELYGDKGHLINVISNLLENALKYCDQRPNVRVSASLKKKNISIEIEDNGIGIDKKLTKLIFQKFYRKPQGNLHDVKGFGLGLYYVNTIVQAHGGRVTVESSLLGSVFSIDLPYERKN